MQTLEGQAGGEHGGGEEREEKIGRTGSPEVNHGHELACEIGVKGTFIPAAAARGVRGIVRDDVGEVLVEAPAEGLAILRHDEHGALPSMANLVGELRKISGAGEIEEGAGLAAMAVAAGDEDLAVGGSQSEDGAIFAVAAHAIDLKGVEGGAGEFEEAAEIEGEAFGRDAGEVPQRVIEDDEHGGKGRELGEKGEAELFVRGCCGLAHLNHQGFSGGAGKIVDAEVEDGFSEGDGPLGGDGDTGGLRILAQAGTGVDGVVVGEGDDGAQTEGFDLARFELEGEALTEGRGPVGAVEVEGDASGTAATLGLGIDPGTERAAGLKEFSDESEAFFGVPGMAVKGNGGWEGKNSVPVLREQQHLIAHPTSGPIAVERSNGKPDDSTLTFHAFARIPADVPLREAAGDRWNGDRAKAVLGDVEEFALL